MIRLAVISGKGGTGKTMVTAGLSHLFKEPLVCADCDVDAANLEFLTNPRLICTTPFFGSKLAVIDPAACTQCGKCREHCRFDAIDCDSGTYHINPIRCEGCGVCVHICPVAITLQPRQTGEIRYSTTDRGHLVHAALEPGAGNSGLLVHAVKKTAIERDGQCRFLLIDGPPGTGCPLISTISGVDAVLIVTEPSVSGLHDLKRVIAVCRQFRPRIYVVINRFDIDLNIADAIEAWCRNEGIFLISRIPFDPAVINAVRAGIPVTEAGASPAAQAIQTLATKLEQEMTGLGTER